MNAEGIWPCIEKPHVEWHGEFPVGQHFDDIYFSIDGVIPEKTEVFIEANDLPCRFVKMRSEPSARAFTVGELGFGFGINFLLTAQKFLNEAPESARLLYVSTERFLLSLQDLKKGHQHLPGFASLSKRLLEVYPASFVGFHTIRFIRHRIDLLLLLGDATEQLKELEIPIQAWFLDGFSPKKNPELWSDDLFQEMRRLSIPGETTLSSYTVAGAVKRGLEQQGFTVEKKPGFSQKKERLVGYLPGEKKMVPKNKPIKKVLIVGVGIAAHFLADELNHCGVTVTVLELEEEFKASNLPSAILAPHLKKGRNPISELSFRGYEIAMQRAQDYQIPSQTSGGYLRTFDDPVEFQKLSELIRKGCFPEEWVQIQENGLFFPKVSSFKMPDWMDALSAHSPFQRIQGPIPFNDASEWDWIIVAAGSASVRILSAIDPDFQIPLQLIRGQIDFFPKGQCPSFPFILSRNKHLTPENRDGFHALGATYHRVLDQGVRESDSDELSLKFRDDHESWGVISGKPDHSWVGFRVATQDRLPLIGPLERLHNIGVFSALGSRGLTFGAVGASVLAHLMVGDGLMIERRLFQNAMDVNR